MIRSIDSFGSGNNPLEGNIYLVYKRYILPVG